MSGDELAKQLQAELKRKAAAQRRKARHRILTFLAGQVNAALEMDPNHSWVFKDLHGDKLKISEEKQAARLEAHRIMRAFDEERELLEDT